MVGNIFSRASAMGRITAILLLLLLSGCAHGPCPCDWLERCGACADSERAW